MRTAIGIVCCTPLSPPATGMVGIGDLKEGFYGSKVLLSIAAPCLNLCEKFQMHICIALRRSSFRFVLRNDQRKDG